MYARFRLRQILFLSLMVLLLPGCGAHVDLFQDGLAAIRGEGGTIARSDEFTSTVEHARALTARRPATTWETVVPYENADFIQFIDARRVLVGHVQVEAYLGVPSYQGLTLYEADTGKKLWDVAREHLPQGEYSVIAVEPLIVMLGKNDSTLMLTGVDPATGARRWHASYKSAMAHGLSIDRAQFILLTADGGKLRLAAIETRSGRELWSRALPEDSVSTESRPTILADNQGFFLAGRKVLRIDSRDGRVMWTSELKEAEEVPDTYAVLVPGGVLVWSAKSVALIEAGNGRVRWRQGVRQGGLKLVSVFANQLFQIITPNTEEFAAGSPTTDKIESLELSNGRSRWLHETGGTVVSQLVLEQGTLMFSLEEAVIGITATSGTRRFRSVLPAAFRIATPTNYDPAGQPDLLHVRAGKLYLSRESAGLIAYSLPSGSLLWHQGNFTQDSRSYPYSTAQRVQRLKSFLVKHGHLAQGGSPALSHFYQPTPNFQLQNLQRQHNALAIERGQALHRGDTGKAHQISRHMEINMQMQSFNQQIDSAQQILSAGLSLAAAVQASLKNKALNGAIARVTMEISHTTRLHREAFHGRYWLRPFIDAINDKVHGVTLVDLDTGRRHDLMASPMIQSFTQSGIEAPPIAVDPSGKRFFTVGVGLKPDLYQSYVLWKVRLPRPSLLAYDIQNLRFSDKNGVVERRIALDETWQPGREQQIAEAVAVGNPITVRRVLDAGLDVDTRSLHGYTPLMIAADAGNELMTQLLLRRGANVHLTALGHTALDFATNAKVEKLLMDAGASKKTAIPAATLGPIVDGGESISSNFRPKILVSYAANPGEEVSLVETSAGPAILTRLPSGIGMLHKYHWRDKFGDHFALSINLVTEQGPGIEFIVPSDRRKTAVMFMYQPGTYRMVEVEGGGARRPLPRPSAPYERILLGPRGG